MQSGAHFLVIHYNLEATVTGVELKSLMQSLEIKGSELARELGVDATTVRDFQRAGKLESKTETKITAALGVIARRHAESRRRERTAELLAVVAD